MNAPYYEWVSKRNYVSKKGEQLRSVLATGQRETYQVTVWLVRKSKFDSNWGWHVSDINTLCSDISLNTALCLIHVCISQNQIKRRVLARAPRDISGHRVSGPQAKLGASRRKRDCCTPAAFSNKTQQAKRCNMAKSFKHPISSSCNEGFSCGLQLIRSLSGWSGGVMSQTATSYSSTIQLRTSLRNIFQCSNIVKSFVPSSWNEI